MRGTSPGIFAAVVLLAATAVHAVEPDRNGDGLSDSQESHKYRTVEEQFAHDLFGRDMFVRKTHGTRTSAAVYLTTVLRAGGRTGESAGPWRI